MMSGGIYSKKDGKGSNNKNSTSNIPSIFRENYWFYLIESSTLKDFLNDLSDKNLHYNAHFSCSVDMFPATP